MKQVAIIITREVLTSSDDYQDTCIKIAGSITEWSEVTDEQYEILKRAQAYDYHHNFVLIERPQDEKKFIEATVAGYLKWAKKVEDDRKAEEQKRKDASLQRKLKKEARTKADRLKLLEQLKSEFPDQ